MDDYRAHIRCRLLIKHVLCVLTLDDLVGPIMDKHMLLYSTYLDKVVSNVVFRQRESITFQRMKSACCNGCVKKGLPIYMFTSRGHEGRVSSTIYCNCRNTNFKIVEFPQFIISEPYPEKMSDKIMWIRKIRN